MDKNSNSLLPEIEFSMTNYGMRYRHKRTHAEMMKTLSVSNQNNLKAIEKEYEPNIKKKLNVGKGQKSRQSGKENDIEKILLKKDELKESNSKISESESSKEEDVKSQRSNDIKKDDSDKKVKQISLQYKTDITRALNKETERFSNELLTLESNFYTNKLPILMKRIEKYCKREITKDYKKQKTQKILDFYKNPKFQLERTYSSDTAAINYPIALFDLLLSKNSAYESIIINESSYIGNLLLYFYSQTNLIRLGKLLLPLINLRVSKATEVQVVNFGNVDNIRNAKMDSILNNIYETLKEYKTKYFRGIKTKFAGELKDTQFVSSILDMMKTQRFPLFKNLFTFDFDKEPEVKEILNSNVNLPLNFLTQNNFDKTTNKIMTEIKVKMINKRIKTHKMQKMKEKFNLHLTSKIIDLNIFYVNTAELILDYLSDD